ncbi:unnamed protein product [Adineta ricciae]|uniref:FG-GAP repeat protein n=1 Tax=Adineta ricciae TaxID=249248 RepID=A0A816AR05_ADIRI|nr:unnamed protein product [Adineta ricciae]
MNCEAFTLENQIGRSDSVISQHEEKIIQNNDSNEIGAQTDESVKETFLPSGSKTNKGYFIFVCFTIIIIIIGSLIVYYKSPEPPGKTCTYVLKSMADSSIGFDSYPQSVNVADFNKDGLSDIIIANAGTNNIGVFLRQEDGSFSDQMIYSTGSGSAPSALVLADFNHDQQVDVAVANYGRNNIGIFLGTINGTFTSQKIFSTGSSHPIWIDIGDFNSDTHIDLAVVNYGTDTIGIHFGDGYGNFAQPILTSTGFDSIPYALVVADLNNDMKLDVVVANYGTNNIGIFFGNNDGLSDNQLLINTGVNSQPFAINIYDLNNDTYLDIIVTCSGTNRIGVVLGLGNGSFATIVEYFTGVKAYPVSLAIGDINKDNNADIVIANYAAGNICILFGYGNGLFTEYSVLFSDSQYNPYSIALNDFNNDSYLDIATVDYNYNYLDIVLTYRSYSFLGQISYSTTGLNSYSESVFLADFDNNNQLDMVVANYWTNDILVFLRYTNQTFADQQRYSTGRSSGPTDVISADFDNDNHLDIAVANYGTNTMGIFLNYGNGTFSSQTTYSTGSNSQPIALTSGFFNNDPWIDIVILNYRTGSIRIFLGIGNGSFINQITYSINRNAQPYDVIISDFNKDNCSDIAVANYATNSISVFIGYGNGTFSSQKTFSTGSNSGPTSLVSSDINGDKLLDIIVANYDSNTIGIFYGYGNGSFKLNMTIFTGTNSEPVAITISDMNNDTLPDILVTNYGSGNVGIFLGQANNSFSTQMSYSTGDNSNPYSIAVGDLNNDGYFDIAVANYGTSSAGLFFGYGNGSFSSQITYSTRGSSNPNCVAVGDFNNDTHSDIVVVNYWAGCLDIFLGNGNGTFYHYMTYSTDSGSYPYAVVIGDFNGDLTLDLAIANSGTNVIGIFLGYGDGTFSSQTTYSTGADSEPYSVAIGDLDNDNRLDIAIANYYSNTIGILQGFGNGSFANQTTVLFRAYSGPRSIVLSDLNNDGYLDIVVGYYDADSVAISLGYGNMTFSNQTLYSFATGSTIYDVTVGNINDDNHPDIIVTSYYSRTVTILLGNGDGTFIISASHSTGSGSRPLSVLVRDWNNDNKTDIAVTNCNIDNIFILIGIGNGTFIESANYSTGEGSCPTWIMSGNFNNDNLLDIVVANYDSDTIGVFLGSTYISATREDTYSTGLSPHPRIVTLADFNYDDQLDIALVNYQLGNVGILLGHTNGTFPLQTMFSIDDLSFPTSLALGYLNNDTYIDITVANSGTENVAILYGHGNGSFTQPSMYSTGLDSIPQSVSIGDFNNDKEQDIVIAISGTNNVLTLLKYDTGAFQRQTPLKTGMNSIPRAVAIADFNKDDRLDFVILNSGNENIGIFLGLGDGTFSNQTTYPLEDGSNPWTIVVYDIDKDDCLDILVANSWTDDIAIFLGYGNGTFMEQITYYIDYNTGPEGIAIADFDNDGRWDIVINLQFSNQIVVAYGYENGTFSNKVFYSTGTYSYPGAVAVGDLNHDNYVDIVVANYGTDDIRILYGQSSGNFSNTNSLSCGYNANPKSILIIDLNEDENLDIVVANSGTDNIGIFFGRSDGMTFEQKFLSTGVGSAPYGFVVNDINNDKQLDLIVANYGTNNIGVLLGCVNGSFFSPLTYSTGDYSQPWKVALGDFNNDSRLDAVVASFGTNVADVFLGFANHDYLSAPPFSTGISSQPTSTLVVDLNNDTRLDVIVANNGTNNIMIIFGTGYVAIGHFNDDNRWDLVVANSGTDTIGVFLADETGLFSNQITYSTGLRSRPYSVVVLDFNHDTHLDIAVATYGANSIGVFYGDGNGTFTEQQIFPTDFV